MRIQFKTDKSVWNIIPSITVSLSFRYFELKWLCFNLYLNKDIYEYIIDLDDFILDDVKLFIELFIEENKEGISKKQAVTEIINFLKLK